MSSESPQSCDKRRVAKAMGGHIIEVQRWAEEGSTKQ